MWEFKLRKGVKFHNGDTMTAEDVKYSFDRVLDILKEKAPSIFLFHQFDTLGTSKKVQYAARGDEWLWLYDAKPVK